MTELTLEQAIIVMGYTGYSTCGFSYFHADVEKRLGRPVFTHEFPGLKEIIQEAYREDFIAMCVTDSYNKRH